MNSRVSLALMLICMLLSDTVHGVRWQGTGSGINNTVLTEIWFNLESNLNTALTTNSQAGYNAFSKEISDRLNTLWAQAWNVVLVKTQAIFDTVLYGYAFRNQWMWFNGVPNSVLGSSSIGTLIVWKDYNCMDWSFIGGESTGFNSNQINDIERAGYMTDSETYKNNIWGVAYNLIDGLKTNSNFPQGGYSVIMSQDPNFNIYGRICKVGNQFYSKNTLLAMAFQNQDGSFRTENYGSLYLFRTR